MSFWDRWRIGSSLMIAGFTFTGFAATVPLALWQLAKMCPDMDRWVFQIINGVWTVFIFLIGPIICYRLASTVFELESNPSEESTEETEPLKEPK